MDPRPCYVEAFSVITRMPTPVRPDVASEALAERAEERILPLVTPASHIVERCARAGIRGGAVYDALIAVTCMDHGAALKTRDRRARRTYEALGLAFELVI